MVGYGPTMALTGNGELGFDFEEGALETATTSKEGSRRVACPSSQIFLVQVAGREEVAPVEVVATALDREVALEFPPVV
ncbi:unnamed protein product [Peronospora belbahrii]|uniref:Uncharacterized protein n=1 Tax=Peronospora belbahrii TaxID=622444 RepID=A0ABN8DC10_9STRA|nr:unnamed protein product [Peronospora belbahrii]